VDALVCMLLATYAQVAGLTRSEASELFPLLQGKAVPHSVEDAWAQLEEVTIEIRKRRFA
jgi:hypothetical protein